MLYEKTYENNQIIVPFQTHIHTQNIRNAIEYAGETLCLF